MCINKLALNVQKTNVMVLLNMCDIMRDKFVKLLGVYNDEILTLTETLTPYQVYHIRCINQYDNWLLFPFISTQNGPTAFPFLITSMLITSSVVCCFLNYNTVVWLGIFSIHLTTLGVCMFVSIIM